MKVELKIERQRKSLQSSFNIRMDRFRWKCNKKTTEVKENYKRNERSKQLFIKKNKTK